jgi:hypothetical protein
MPLQLDVTFDCVPAGVGDLDRCAWGLRWPPAPKYFKSDTDKAVVHFSSILEVMCYRVALSDLLHATQFIMFVTRCRTRRGFL